MQCPYYYCQNLRAELWHYTETKFIIISYFKQNLLYCMMDTEQRLSRRVTVIFHSKSRILYIMMTINRIYCVFTLLTSWLNYSNCCGWCSTDASSVKKQTPVSFLAPHVFLLLGRVWYAVHCACCELPHWPQWPHFAASTQVICLCSADASCANWGDLFTTFNSIQLINLFPSNTLCFGTL